MNTDSYITERWTLACCSALMCRTYLHPDL